MSTTNKLIITIVFFLIGISTRAQNTRNTDSIVQLRKVNYSIGLGLGITNQYDGSDDYLILPNLVFSADWNNGRYIRLSGLGLDINISKNRKWEYGPIVRFKLNRNDNIVDNEAVANLESLGFGISAGLMGRYNFAKGLDIKAEYAQDISGVSDGGLALLHLRYTKFSKRFINRLTVGTSYGTERYLNTYFGVNSDNIGSSTLSNYTIGAGFRDISTSVNSTYVINRQWLLSAQIGYTRLIGDASDSPLVIQGSSNQIQGGLIAIYRF